jgi:hypothetical protein
MIIPEGNQSTQNEIALAINVFLSTCAYGWAPYKKPQSRSLFFNVPRFIRITAIDREPSNSRGAETKYQMAIRNAHRSADALFVKKDGGLQLASRIKKTG